MQRPVQILGNGIAAVASSRLLADSSIQFRSELDSRPGMAAILIGTQTQSLLKEIFQDVDCLSLAHPIESRTVLWGESASAVTLPHRGLVISEPLLLDSLWQRVPAQPESPAMPADEEQSIFSIITANADFNACEEFSFGQRKATVHQVFLRDAIDRHACVIESVASGWLFLLPLSADRAALLSVSIYASPQDQLAQSRLVKDRIDAIIPSNETPVFPCAPRLSLPLATERALRCGSAAMRFDPVCGEGAGNALREAFLAAAVITALESGEPIDKLSAHYSTRLLVGFFRHLQICRSFYATGGTDKFWLSELSLLDAGIVRVKELLAKMPRPSYRFNHRSLEAFELIS